MNGQLVRYSSKLDQSTVNCLYVIEKCLNKTIQCSLLTDKLNEEQSKSIFDRFEGGISIFGFMCELIESFDLDVNILIYSLILVKKLYVQSKLNITIKNIFIILYTSVFISAKMLLDVRQNEEEFGVFIGISPKDLGLLEAHFLMRLNYKVFIDETLFHQFKQVMPLIYIKE